MENDREDLRHYSNTISENTYLHERQIFEKPIQCVDRYGFILTNENEKLRTNVTDDNIDVDKLRKRELKWIEMLHKWPETMSRKFLKVKKRCRKGIPASVRAWAWRYLCGAVVLEQQHPEMYKNLIALEGDPRVLSDIEKDLHRSFPNHELFYDKDLNLQHKEGHYIPSGQSDLYDMLKAYSLYNPAVGYCQAIAPVAAVLLMHLPVQQAFWVLVAICENYLTGYYNPGLDALKEDGDILEMLFAKVCPQGCNLLRKHKTEPVLYMTEWFMCIFSRSLPWATVLRIWDMFLCEGVKVLFRVALAWLKIALNIDNERLKSCDNQLDVLNLIRHVPQSKLSAAYLIDEMNKLPINEEDMFDANKIVFLKRMQLKNNKKK